MDATIVGISAQDLDSHRGFIEKNSLTVALLADVDKQVARLTAPRVAWVASAVIVIDEQGIVRHRHDHRLGLDYKPMDELKTILGGVVLGA